MIRQQCSPLPHENVNDIKLSKEKTETAQIKDKEEDTENIDSNQIWPESEENHLPKTKRLQVKRKEKKN